MSVSARDSLAALRRAKGATRSTSSGSVSHFASQSADGLATECKATVPRRAHSLPLIMDLQLTDARATQRLLACIPLRKSSIVTWGLLHGAVEFARRSPLMRSSTANPDRRKGNQRVRSSGTNKIGLTDSSKFDFCNRTERAVVTRVVCARPVDRHVSALLAHHATP